MKTVEDIRNELNAIASELRPENDGAAARLDALNHSFYTTTTEYLVETMDLIQELSLQDSVRGSAVAGRLRAVERSARALANLR